MAQHWTYEGLKPEDDLTQGDVLEPTDELLDVFRQVHPHFCDPKYTGFLVTTQSCDLVMRKGGCSTRYINIAVIRLLESILHDVLSRVCKSQVIAADSTGKPDRIYFQESKGEARKLVERVFGQNEQALGLFYLHPDAEVGIASPSVAVLRVNIALRVDHYEMLKRARRGSLSAEFKSKLGWLVGNLYSRVGTQDWTDPPARKPQLEKLIRDILDGSSERGPLWVSESSVNAARESGIDFLSLPRDAVLPILERHKPRPQREAVVDEVARVAKVVFPHASEAEIDKLRRRLLNDERFSKTLKRAE